MNLLIKFILSVFCLLLSVQVTLAEQADRTKPVNIEADSVDMDDINKVGLYQGSVVLLQGTLMLRADKIEVHQDADGFSTAVAFGNPVYFRQKQDGSEEYVEAYANRIDLDNKQNTVLLTGNARLKKGANELHANTMLYNTVTERFWAKNDPSATPGATPNRVRTAIFPKVLKNPPAQPALPLQPTTALQPGTESGQHE